MKASSLAMIFAMLLSACSSTSVDPIVNKSQEKTQNQVKRPAEPENPCLTFSKLSPQQRDEAETAYVLYRDQIRLKNTKAALPLWRKAYKLAPAANGRVHYQFDDGVSMYKQLFQEAQTESLKRLYMDSIIGIYDKRMECFGEESYITARKAFDNYYVFGEFADEEQTFELFKSVIDEQGSDAEYFVINPFTKLLYDRIASETISLEEGRKYALTILEAVDKGLNNCEDNCEAWEIIADYSPQRLEALEGIKSFYPCDYYETKYYAQFISNPEDCENIGEVHRKLLWGECPGSNEVLSEVSNSKDTHCYTPPPPEGPLRRAFNAYNEGEFTNAIELFQEFVDRTEDVDKKGRYTLLIAKIYYRDFKDFANARKFALRAAGHIPQWGEPYMLIGKLYASSGPLCGPGRGWDSQIVTWPAIDKFEYAKSIDPEVSEEANALIRQYRQYMPSMEDVFLRPEIQEGERFLVPCWIQEWTTIRAARN